MTPKIFSVSELTHSIKNCLEKSFPNVSCQGEISNAKFQASGHFYFSLKDHDAQISAVMFRADVARLPNRPKDGDKVTVRGQVNVYPPRGQYQLTVREMALQGVGELLLRLDALKREIHSRGWFKQEHKKPIPSFPECIGVVTSPTGAVIQDIINVLRRRAGGFKLLLNPVRVQGSEAAAEIAQAIRQFNEYKLADVLIVGRGGGSIEDLWPFNEEVVAKAIFESEIPIVAAVGHETDHTIAEYVADLRAPTPSAAAEVVSHERFQLLDRLKTAEKRLSQGLKNLLLGSWQRLDDLDSALNRTTLLSLRSHKQHLEAAQKRLQTLEPSRKIHDYLQRLALLDLQLQKQIKQTLQVKSSALSVQKNLDSFFQAIFKREKERIHQIQLRLDAINPKNLLQKGYSIVFSEKDHSVISSSRALHRQDKLRILLSDGEALATVDEVKATL